jgi:CHAT domain-containing protein
MRYEKFAYFAFLSWILTSACSAPDTKFDTTSSLSTQRAIVRGEIKDALESYESQAADAEKNAAASLFPRQYWTAAASAYREASRAALLSGQLQKSIALAEKALEFGVKLKDPARQLDAIGPMIDAYTTIRNFDKVRGLIEKGLIIVKEIPTSTNPRIAWEAGLTFYLGLDHMRRNESEKAIQAFSNSLYHQRDYLGNLERWRAQPWTRPWLEPARIGLISRLNWLGNAYRQAKKLAEAMEQYQQAFASIKEMNLNYPYENGLYEAVGEVYRLQGNLPQALENYQKALAIAESQRRPAAVRSASNGVGNILRQTGKSDEAIPYYRKSIQQIESTRSFIEQEDQRQTFFEGATGAYVNLMRALLTAGRREEAFDFNERARSRVFLDVLGSKAQLSRVKGGLLEEERALNERIAAIKAKMAGEGQESGTANLRQELRDAENAYNAFLAKVRKQDKEQASLMSVQPLTLKEVRELLDPGTTLIEYFVTPTDIFVWVVDKDRLRYQRVALPRPKLSSQVQALRESIFALGEKQKLDEASTALYKQLVQPLVPYITGKELIIVPHDVLHYLPFQALVAPDGKYLIESYSIYYLSSASLLQFVKDKKRAGGEKVLAFGNPDLGDAKMNLEFAGIEAKEIKSLYPQSSIYLAKEATEERAKSLSPQSDIIHFASHAELNEDDPLSSAVLLAKSDKEDGRLEVREIFGMDLKARLVVLSACETGLGKLSSGDELVGLTRAFIYAGTPSVVASLWNVEDSSTAQLMASFYKNLKTMTKVEALRQAQLNLIRGNINSDLLARRGIGGVGKLGEIPSSGRPTPGSESRSPDSSAEPVSISTSHPYFWAPFILVGEGK